VNGRPSFLQVNKASNLDEIMMWYSDGGWYIGRTERKGDTCGWLCVDDNALEPDRIEGSWRVWKDCEGLSSNQEFMDAPLVQLLCKRNSDSEVAVTGERTREQRDAEGRKHAIDLEEKACKRSKVALEALDKRVATARSLCSTAVDARFRELFRPALDEYTMDAIDEAELGRRKAKARSKAATEHKPLITLNDAFDKYTAACSARDEAEALLETATTAADTAQALLEAALLEMEPGVANDQASNVKPESQSESPA